MTTTAKLDLLTATGAGNLPTALAAINGFIRATAGDVPDPVSITVYKFDTKAAVHFDSLDDLRNWAAYLQVPVTANDVRPQYDSIHHRADAKWGPINGKMVEFEMVYIEKLPEPTPAEFYDCEKCGAGFGIAGTNMGTPEDDAAEEYHREEILRHESGECVTGPRDCEAGEWS